MTQQEKFIALMEEFKINFKIFPVKAKEIVVVEIDEGEGYTMFSGEFVFDKDGKFHHHSLVE